MRHPARYSISEQRRGTNTKKLYCWVLALALLLSGCVQTNTPGGDAAKTENSPAAPEAEELLETLCSAEYQGRAVGGTGNALAAEYIASFFGALGLEPLFDDFLQPYEEQCVKTEQAEAHAALIASDGTRTELTAGIDFIFYPVYKGVEVTLPISEDAAACADGTAFFYAEDEQEARSFSSDKPDSFSVGCAGLEEYTSLNNNTDPDRGTFLLLAETYRVPLRAKGTKLELSLSPCLEEGTASNVAAVLRGSEGKNAFIVGAHFDGTGVCGDRLYPSAYDNASGTVTMLEIARLLADAELKSDVIFVAFNGEESGKDGASAFADQVLTGYERVNLIDFDCVGHRDSETFTVFDDYGLNAPLRTALMDVLGDTSAGGDDLMGDGNVFSDFANVSCVTVADCDVDNLLALSPIHSPGDLSEQIDFTRIRELASAAAEIIRAETLYEQDASNKKDEIDEQTGLLLSELEQYHQLIDNGTLNAYTQAYVYSTEKGSSLALTGGMKRLLSAEELEAACPGLGAPESIGDYRFAYAELQGMLDGSQRYNIRINLPETLEVGTLIDLTGRITPVRVFVYYLAPDGRGIEIFTGPAMEGFFADMEDGGALDPVLEGVMLAHSVKPEVGLDGYRRLALPQENQRVVCINFFDGASFAQPVTGWEEDQWPLERYLTADELLAEFAALDLTPFEKICEQIQGS